MSRSEFVEKNITLKFNESRIFRHHLTASGVLFATEASFSLIANLIVVLLFSCRQHLLRKPHNRCILSLSIADILTSVSIFLNPNFVLGEQHFETTTHNYLTRELYCLLLWNNFLLFALGVTSLYTSVALSFERWLAVRKSMFYRTRFKTCHMNTMILATWIAGFSAEIPVIFFTEVVHDQSRANCRWNFPKKMSSVLLSSTGLFLIQAVLPAVFLTLAYIDVFRGIRESLRFAMSARTESRSGVQRLKKVTKVAGITSFVLAVCWLPCSVAFLHSLLNKKPLRNPNHSLVVFFVLLTFGNSCINPCIYVFSNPELRDALKEILGSCKRTHARYVD